MGSADANERISCSYERRKHQPHCRDEEMRHIAVKVKSFHLLLVPSLRLINMVSELGVTFCRWQRAVCLWWSPVPQGQGAGLDYFHPPWEHWLIRINHTLRKIVAKCHSTTKITLLCWPGVACMAVHNGICLHGWITRVTGTPAARGFRVHFLTGTGFFLNPSQNVCI